MAAGITEGVVQSEQVNVTWHCAVRIYLADTREVVTCRRWLRPRAVLSESNAHQGRIPRVVYCAPSYRRHRPHG